MDDMSDRACRRPRRPPRRGRAWLAPVALLLAMTTCRSSDAPRETLAAGVTRSAVTGRDDWTLSYLAAGDPAAPRVVFVHGTPGDAANFQRYLHVPIANAYCVALDRPGFGDSHRRGGRPAVPEFTDQAGAIVDLLDALPPSAAGLPRPVFVGHSLGGPIIARFAAEHPKRVGAVVILAGSLDPALESPQWYNYLAAFPLVNWLLSPPLQNSNAEIFAAPAETAALAELLGEIRCPVIIVHGEKDSLVPVANVAFMQKQLRNARPLEVRRLPDAGHLLPWKNETEVRAAIDWALRAAAANAAP